SAMSPLARISIIFAIWASSEARVTFPYSEVLQVNALINLEAPFNCDDGCKVYVDRKDDSLHITQNGQFIANFNDIVGKDSIVPEGWQLEAGKGYKVQSRSSPNADFVFYAVSSKAPNFGAPVFNPQTKIGVMAYGVSRYFTVLSSFNAVEYYGFNGTFPKGYPKIYATGFDAVGDKNCVPVHQARSQYNAEQSRPTIFAPIVTVDFGYYGDHVVGLNQNNGKSIFRTKGSSTVYMSPGYVGCSNVNDQVYFSNVNSVQDNFDIWADSLDVSAVYNAVTEEEKVQLRVDEVNLDFSGSASFTIHYPNPFTFDVSIAWQRKTASSSWAVQLDFGVGDQPPATNSPPPTTSASEQSTTSIGNTV
ncbi:hypothetical protein PENTCL1PPCAC_13443, partial [Pristionchus entomophagus]